MTDSELRQFTDCERLHDAIREFLLQFDRIVLGPSMSSRGKEIEQLVKQLKRVI